MPYKSVSVICIQCGGHKHGKGVTLNARQWAALLQKCVANKATLFGGWGWGLLGKGFQGSGQYMLCLNIGPTSNDVLILTASQWLTYMSDSCPKVKYYQRHHIMKL